MDGRIHLTRQQYRLLGKHKRALRTLASRSVSDRTKLRMVNQKGGFLGGLLATLIPTVIAPLMSNLMGK